MHSLPTRTCPLVRQLLTLLLALAPASAGLAETYYVDSRRGDDAAAGTTDATAWRTLDRVHEQALSPGDEVRFAAGSSYDGQLAPSSSGAAGKPIVFGSYGDGPKPRIDGHGEVGAAVLLRNVEFVTVEDLHLTNYGGTRGPERYGLYILLENFGEARDITARRLQITNVNGSLLKRVGGAGIRFRNAGDAKRSRFNGLLIEDNVIRRSERNGITGGSEYVDRSKWYPSLNVVIRGNVLEEVPGDGIVPIGCDGAIVERNVIRNGTPLLRKEHGAAAGIWPWSCDNTLIQFNEVSRHRARHDGQGFDADWNCRGTIIQYNYSHHNDGGFLLVCDDGNSSKSYSAGNTGAIIRWNVSFNDGLREVSADTSAGERAPSINLCGPVDKIDIYGNVIIAPAKATERVDDNFVIATSWGGFPKTVRVRENVFAAEKQGGFDVERAGRLMLSDNVYAGDIKRPDGASAETRAAEEDLFKFPGDGVDNGLGLLDRLAANQREMASEGKPSKAPNDR